MTYHDPYVTRYIHSSAAIRRMSMSVLVGFALWTAVVLAAQQVSIDFGPIGNAIVWAATVSGAAFALYRMWVKPLADRIVGWFVHQGAVHEGIAADITHIRSAVDDHDRRIANMEHVIWPPVTGGEGEPTEPFYLTTEQIEAARARILRRLHETED